MGGPSIDAGAPCGDPRIKRYTPPVPEFEVLMATCKPGEELTLPGLKVKTTPGYGSSDAVRLGRYGIINLRSKGVELSES